MCFCNLNNSNCFPSALPQLGIIPINHNVPKLFRLAALCGKRISPTLVLGRHLPHSITMAPATTRSQTRNLLVAGQPFETPASAGASLDTVAARLKAAHLPTLPPASTRAAAVLAALFEDQDGRVCVVCTRRSSALKSHSGEVCLPGGKRDEEDVDDVACALRYRRGEGSVGWNSWL